MPDTEFSKRAYVLNTIALLLLLGVTLGVAELRIEPLGVIVALLVAGLKAFLVGVFFMHLKLVQPITRIFAVAGVIWLAILIGLTLTDTETRGWIKTETYEPQPPPGSQPPYQRSDQSTPNRTLTDKQSK